MIPEERPHHERIEDPLFRRAVDLVDAGDVEGLRRLLATHPALARQRVRFPEGGYFAEPSLLEFVAENPVRRDAMPANAIEVARVILDAGADADAVGGALGLIASGRVPREQGHQLALIDLLVDRGADPNGAMLGALTHGEFEAVHRLLERGARTTLPVAAALGLAATARELLAAADARDRQLGLAYASQHGHVDIVRLLLDAGVDPNIRNPPGAHAHSMPLHQAVWYEHAEVVRLLLERGARTDVKDTAHQGTPLDWAIYGKRDEMARILRAHLARR